MNYWKRLYKKTAISALVCLLMVNASAGILGVEADSSIIPEERRVDWKAGVPGGIPQYPVSINIKDAPFNAVGDGTTDDTLAFKKAIAVAPSGTAVLIPAGKYRITRTIELSDKGVVLRGEGADKTHLLFDCKGTGIKFHRWNLGDVASITGGLNKGSTVLTVSDGSAFKKGNYADVGQENDPKVMYTNPAWKSDWNGNAVGQMVKITGVEGNKITIQPALHRDFSLRLKPTIYTVRMVEGAGLENLHLKRLDTNDDHLVSFEQAANCWMSKCVSELARKNHVNTRRSIGLEIRDSYFNDATQWDGGGHGYGVGLGDHVTDCLVENNIFNHLRHSIIFSKGASGNVIDYNYSVDPYQDSPDNWTPADISLHGNQPAANLFEGNVVQKIHVSDYWGPSGPWNTFFRNHVEGNSRYRDDRTFNIDDHSNNQNVVGNQLVVGTIKSDGTVDMSTVLIHGNGANGIVTWSAAIKSRVLPVSIYYQSKPAFYGTLPWPSLGAGIINGTNPAKIRYQKGIMIP